MILIAASNGALEPAADASLDAVNQLGERAAVSSRKGDLSEFGASATC
jgi:hypothetical protein